MTSSLYKFFLNKYAFTHFARFKDQLKVSGSYILPKIASNGRIIYYHYVFPENYCNFIRQIEFYERVGFSDLNGSRDFFSITFDDTYRLNMPVY